MSTAEAYLRKGYELFKETGVNAHWAQRFFYMVALLVQVELRLGKVEEATRHVKELWENAKLFDEDLGYAYTREAEGLLFAERKEWASAVRSFQKSIESWKKIGWPYEEGKTLYELGVAYQESGDSPAANEPFKRALEMFTRLGAISSLR